MRRLVLPLLWIGSLQLALFWLAFGGQQRALVGDEGSYLQAARGLLETGRLVLDPLWPPLYVYFLAAILKLGGPTMLVLALVQNLLLFVAALAWKHFVESVLGSERAGWLSALAMVAFPTMAAFAYYAWPEILFLALFLPACALLVSYPESLATAVLCGVLLAAAMLAKLVLWPFLPCLVLPALVAGSSRSLRAALVAVALAVLIVFYGGARLRPDGGAARADTNIAFNLLLGLEDRSTLSFVDDVAGDEYRAYLSSANDTEARTRILWERVRSLARERGIFALLKGQLSKQYARLFSTETFFTAQLPGGALDGLRGGGYRGVPAALANAMRAIEWFCYLAVVALAFVGVVQRPWRTMSRAQLAWLAVLAVYIGYQLSIFLVLHVVSRYRIAMMPVFFLFAAAACDRISTFVKQQREHAAAAPDSIS